MRKCNTIIIKNTFCDIKNIKELFRDMLGRLYT